MSLKRSGNNKTRWLVVAGVRSGVGKTTVATGLMAALTRRGLKIQPFKAGPDYIDPSYHEVACGVPSRNLDTWMLTDNAVLELAQRAASGSDVAIVEGVMGLYDGRSSLTEEGSTAQLAKLLGAPVVLVVDAAAVARSVAAEVLGFIQFDPEVNIAGVVLSGIAGPGHLEFCQPQIEATTSVPVVGWLPRRKELSQPERHLGLIPAVENSAVREWLDRLVLQAEETMSPEGILALAGPGPTGRTVSPALYPAEPQPKTATIAVAMDKAFSFYYQDSLDLLEAWGAEVAPFSPLEDEAIPRGAAGVYLGGGFPELYAGELARNTAIRQALREAARMGIPIYGECGGLMYLGRSLTDPQGSSHEMAGLLPLESSMAESRLTLGYREVEALSDGPLLAKGQRVRGHEFHWSIQTGAPTEETALYAILEKGGLDKTGPEETRRKEGFRVGSVAGSYVHLHMGTDPTIAPRFVQRCASAEEKARG